MLELILLACALAADAVAVSIARGAAGAHSPMRAVETGLAFGVAQGLMPLLGWGLGALFAGWIAAVDHWIAFVLLTGLGLRMLFAAFTDGEAAEAREAARNRGYYLALLAAAIATSIDAAAAGLTLDLFGLPVWQACLVIGVVTAATCIPAYWFSARLGSRLGTTAEAVGGVVLVGLGTKILMEHMAY